MTRNHTRNRYGSSRGFSAPNSASTSGSINGTKTYAKIGPPGRFEAALLRDLLMENRTVWVRKVLPVVPPGRRIGEIPTFLQPYSASHYRVDELTIDGVEELYRVITRQPRHHLPPSGSVVALLGPDDPV